MIGLYFIDYVIKNKNFQPFLNNLKIIESFECHFVTALQFVVVFLIFNQEIFFFVRQKKEYEIV